MKIALIRPNIGRKEHSMFLDGARMEPLALAVLAGLTPKIHDVALYDDRVAPIPYDAPTDLAAISVEIFTARRAYEIAEQYRKRGVPVILGGIHATLQPDEAAAYADCIVLGDAETQWAQILEDFQAHELKAKYVCTASDRPQQGVLPRREIFIDKNYLPISLIQFSRGCPNQCAFCASSAYFKRRHFFRDPAEVVREIRLQKRKLLFFVDDNIVADKDAAKELFKALIPLKIRWVGQASMDMLSDEELMRLMIKSGCLGNVIGFESIAARNVSSMKKETNAAFVHDGYRHAVAELRRWGLQSWAAFTVGHDDDTPESILETCDFAMHNKFCFAAFNILNPYPQTPFYDRLKQENRLLYEGKWWLHPEYRFNYASFIPKNMSADELTAVSFECRRRFNSPLSIVKRAFEPRTNLKNPYSLITYALYNPLFRREVFNKQGLIFGRGDAT